MTDNHRLRQRVNDLENDLAADAVAVEDFVRGLTHLRRVNAELGEAQAVVVLDRALNLAADAFGARPVDRPRDADALLAEALRCLAFTRCEVCNELYGYAPRAAPPCELTDHSEATAAIAAARRYLGVSP